MLSKIKNIFYIISFCIFISSIILYYFSDYNIKETNKFRSLYIINTKDNIDGLPLLKNDTKNIIEYKNDVEFFKKKKKKYKFWDLIKNI